MNTNSKHTPGPWTVCRSICTTHATPIRVHGENLCWVCGLDSALQFSREQTAANARLIASAPDLLAMLKSAVSYLEANRPKGKIREIFHQLNEYENGVLKPARAAILQAEGGAQ